MNDKIVFLFGCLLSNQMISNIDNVSGFSVYSTVFEQPKGKEKEILDFFFNDVNVYISGFIFSSKCFKS